MINMKRLENENEKQYIWRLASAKESGQIQMNWTELTDVLNAELRPDCPFAEAAYRKPFSAAKAYYDDVFAELEPDEYLQQVREATDNAYKMKRQLSDQRREYNRILVAEARSDNLLETVQRTAREMTEFEPLQFFDCYDSAGKTREAVLVFADWHYSMVAENVWSTYNIEICKARVAITVSKAIEYMKIHGIKKLHVIALGDLIHGSIHTTCRVASEENTVEQLMHVSEILAEALNELSQYVESLDFYSTYGNHARSIQNKKESIHEDNMERIVPWWIKERLSDNDRVQVMDSEYYEFISFNVLGKNIVCSHGDLEKFKDFGLVVNTLFNKKFGISIDYTLTADKHHLEEFEQLGIESILVRSLCGSDEYSNGKRLYSIPGQTLMIFSADDGRECTYSIKLDKVS